MFILRVAVLAALTGLGTSVWGEPVKLYCLGVFADGSPLQTELSIDTDFGEVRFGLGKANTLELRTTDIFKYEWSNTADGANFVTILNRFSGEMTSFKQLKDSEPELHFRANCYRENELKF